MVHRGAGKIPALIFDCSKSVAKTPFWEMSVAKSPLFPGMVLHCIKVGLQCHLAINILISSKDIEMR